MVAADKDVVILRTFSKVYGMAGLRAGAASARPDLQKQISKFSATMMPITGMAAASASLEVKTWFRSAAKIVADIRKDMFRWLGKHNFILHTVGFELLHDRCEASGPRGIPGHDEGESLHRPHLAGLAELGSRHGWNARRNGQVQDGLPEGDGVKF